MLSFQQFIYLCSDKESIKSYLLSDDCYFILSEFYNDSKYRSLLQNNLNIINQITKDIFNLCLRNEAIPRPLVQLSSLSIQIPFFTTPDFLSFCQANISIPVIKIINNLLIKGYCYYPFFQALIEKPIPSIYDDEHTQYVRTVIILLTNAFNKNIISQDHCAIIFPFITQILNESMIEEITTPLFDLFISIIRINIEFAFQMHYKLLQTNFYKGDLLRFYGKALVYNENAFNLIPSDYKMQYCAETLFSMMNIKLIISESNFLHILLWYFTIILHYETKLVIPFLQLNKFSELHATFLTCFEEMNFVFKFDFSNFMVHLLAVSQCYDWLLPSNKTNCYPLEYLELFLIVFHEYDESQLPFAREGFKVFYPYLVEELGKMTSAIIMNHLERPIFSFFEQVNPELIEFKNNFQAILQIKYCKNKFY